MNKHHAELKEAAKVALDDLMNDETVDTYETADDLRELIDLCYGKIHSLGSRADRPKKRGKRKW